MDQILLPAPLEPHTPSDSHKGLNGKTPAEVAGIGIKGENKRLAIIQYASKKRIGEESL